LIVLIEERQGERSVNLFMAAFQGRLEGLLDRGIRDLQNRKRRKSLGSIGQVELGNMASIMYDIISSVDPFILQCVIELFLMFGQWDLGG
jgi:hypothetical protein